MGGKEIFFHVGTGKTGTTFLQYRVFPKLMGIYYIQRTRYKKAIKIIGNTQFGKYLISREFDQQLEDEVRSFSSKYRDVAPIIVFRRHDDYIASQYRRFVKNGFRGSFQEFFDLENDEGLFKKIDLNYSHQIGILEKYFTREPIVLFYDDLRTDPVAFISNLTNKMGTAINISNVNLTRKHTSYSEKQLKAIRYIGRYINIRKRRIFRNGLLQLLFSYFLGMVRYSTLLIAALLPEKIFSDQPLIADQELQQVKDYFNEDWLKCRSQFRAE